MTCRKCLCSGLGFFVAFIVFGLILFDRSSVASPPVDPFFDEEPVAEKEDDGEEEPVRWHTDLKSAISDAQVRNQRVFVIVELTGVPTAKSLKRRLRARRRRRSRRLTRWRRSTRTSRLRTRARWKQMRCQRSEF